MIYKNGIREIEMGSITWRQILNNNFSIINNFIESNETGTGALTNKSLEETSLAINTQNSLSTLNSIMVGNSTSQGNNNIGIYTHYISK